MSLQTRIVALVGAVLLVSIALGAVFAGVQARRALHDELGAAMIGGAQTIHSAFEDLPRSTHPPRDLLQLVQTFNGNRHVLAVLTGPRGIEASSHPSSEAGRAPSWFKALITPALSSVSFAAPGRLRASAAIVLSPAPDADLAATWTQLSGIVTVLCGSALVGLALVFAAVRTALAPLHELSSGLAKIGQGDYRGRVRERGPIEILRLERSFNDMAGRLAAVGRRNEALEQQLLTLQDEERAELARDLHDDIGPHLFAASLDAEMINQLLVAGRTDQIPDQVETIQATVGHVQREIRAMVARLRPARVTELGLNRAIQDLVGFWRSRRGEIVFDVQPLSSEAGLDGGLKDIAFRVVQEAVNNAVRHARPTRIRIALRRMEQALVVEVSNDGASPHASGTGGFGLVGMGERVGSLGGALTIDPAGADGHWGVSAVLPTSGAILAPPARRGGRLNILLVDDHAILRAGLRKLLGAVFEGDIYEAANGREAVAVALTKRLDLILLDLNLPDLGGLELLERLLQVSSAPVLVLSMHAEPLYVTRTLDAGAQGYISKAAPPDELLSAVRKVTAGGRYIEAELAQLIATQPDAGDPTLGQLSSREMELLRLLGAGKTLSEIADALGLSYKTVANTFSIMKSKLGVARTADLVRLALQSNIA